MGDWIVAGKPNGYLPEVGKLYEIRHSRKGTFTGKLLSIDGEWADIEIVRGVARAIMDYNIKYEGEKVTIRDVHSFFTEVEP